MAENTKEIYGKGYTYVVTRRTVQTKTQTKVRVRVRAYEGPIAFGEPVWNEFRDYGPGEWSKGDEMYHKHIKKIQKHVESA